MKAWKFLRWGVLGLAILASFPGFGSASHAPRQCPETGYPYPYPYCGYDCEENTAYCNEWGFCVCGEIP